MRNWLLICTFLFIAITASAQEQRPPRERPTPEQMAERQLQMLTEKLALTPEQQEKVKVLNKLRSERVEAVRQSGDRDQMRVFQVQYKAEMNKILTAEQKVKYEELEKENLQRRGPREEPREGPRPRRNSDN